MLSQKSALGRLAAFVLLVSSVFLFQTVTSVYGVAIQESEADSKPSKRNDWPQINGPTRNGVAVNETLLQSWPKDGLKEVWSHPIGQGNAGPVVSDGKLIVFHRPGANNLCEMLDAFTGKLIWNKELPSAYKNAGPDGDLGPKAVPLVHDDHVYLLGTGGNLSCLQLSDGKVVWQKNVLNTYTAPGGYFGAGSTPIVAGGKLILNVGGDQAGVVAFDLKTGNELWKAVDDRASYSSPIEITVEGKSRVVFVTRLNAVMLDPSNGKELGRLRFGKPGATVNAAMPVKVNDFVFFNSAYNVGGRLVEFVGGKMVAKGGNKANQDFASHYSTPVTLDGKIYGTAGREDFGNGSFRCVDLSAGEIKPLWIKEKFPVGHSILVGDKILILDCKGGFHVIEATPKEFKQIYKCALFDGESRSMPAIANGLFYARSNAKRGKGELVCVEVGNRN